VLHRLNSAATLIQRTTTETPRGHMCYIGLDVHKKTISYCVKNVSGRIQQEGKVGSTRRELDCWMKTLPQPWAVAMEATIFSGWIYDHLLPHATQIKVAHPLMLRAIAAAKKKNDQIDATLIGARVSSASSHGPNGDRSRLIRRTADRAPCTRRKVNLPKIRLFRQFGITAGLPVIRSLSARLELCCSWRTR